MKTIGWLTYQPEMVSKKASSAGGAVWTRYLLDNFVQAGHEVVWLADGAAPFGYSSGSAADCDIVFLNWRWAMPKYPDRNKMYLKQMEIIDNFSDKIPIVVHDQDHKISDADAAKLKNAKATICAPELNPREGVRTLHFPNPFKQEYEVWNKMPFLMRNDFIYIGNVYERYDMALRYLKDFSEQFDTKVWGNWLEEGPDRPGPKQVRKDFPHVDFRGRLTQSMVVETLASATATIHLYKESYGPHGFVTMRWAEAAAASTLGFIPIDFYLPDEIFDPMSKIGIIVSGGIVMAERYRVMTDDTWEAAVMAQRIFVEKNMRLEPWLELIDELVR